MTEYLFFEKVKYKAGNKIRTIDSIAGYTECPFNFSLDIKGDNIFRRFNLIINDPEQVELEREISGWNCTYEVMTSLEGNIESKTLGRRIPLHIQNYFNSGKLADTYISSENEIVHPRRGWSLTQEILGKLISCPEVNNYVKKSLEPIVKLTYDDLVTVWNKQYAEKI